MKVLHVAQPTIAGVPHVVAGLVEDQLARGWRVVVASPEDGDLRRRVIDIGADHVRWSAGRSPDLRVAAETRSLRRIVELAQPQLIHLHSSKAGLAGRLAIRGRHPTIFQPHAWSFHAIGGPMRGAAIGWERFAARWTHALVCVSDGEKAVGEAAGIDAEYFVVPNGIDLSRGARPTAGERQAARSRLGLDDGGSLVVCVGRLCRQKGQSVLLDAWRGLTERFPSATLALVGDGPDRESLAATGAPRVLLAGWSDDVSSWIAAADIVVIPSRWEAGLSLVAMEAMARGRSIVATDVAGARAGLRGEAGAIVPVGDARALGDALAERLRDPGRREAEGMAGRRIVESFFDSHTAMERLVAVYRAVLEGGDGLSLPKVPTGG